MAGFRLLNFYETYGKLSRVSWTPEGCIRTLRVELFFHFLLLPDFKFPSASTLASLVNAIPSHARCTSLRARRVTPMSFLFPWAGF